MTDQKSKHSIHMIIKLHAKTYPLLTKSNWTNSQTKNQNNHSIKSKSSQTNIHMTKKTMEKTKKFHWKISSTVTTFTLKNTFQNDLFQKSNSKKKIENHILVTKQFVIREHWEKKIRNPSAESENMRVPPIRHLWTLYSASHYWVLHIKDLRRVSLPPKYLYSTSSASSETGRLPKHVFNIFFFFCINSAIGTRYFH